MAHSQNGGILMSDDLNNKIKQISEMLGQENMPDNVKNLINLLAGSSSNNNNEDEPVNTSNPTEDKAQSQPRSEVDDNIEMIRKVKTVMDKLNNNNDPRVNLLTAIRPFLNNKRQDKLNSCIKILQMSSIARLMDDSQGKGNFLQR
jgi:hypothetical protein